MLLLSAIGPGLFLIGYNIGTGSITTMAIAGAEFGMTLFWTLVLSSIFTYILMVAYGKLTLVSGNTALYNIKHGLKYGKILALYIMVALIIGEILALMGIMGIVVDLLQEAIRLVGIGFSVSTLAITIFLEIGLFLLLWNGRFKLFEKILTACVFVMGISFFVVFFLVKPDLSEIAKGLIPKIPNKPGVFGIIAAMVGTTSSAAVFIIRSIVVSEKGWKVKHLKTERRDAFVSAFMMLLLSGVIMAVSAGTLHVMGLKLTNTVEMVQLFQPLGGKIAAFILIIGVASAALSTIFPIILIAPWLICDYTGRPRNMKSPLFRILGLIGLLFGFGFQFIDQRPPAMMILSQAFQACILPAVTLPVLLLMNKESLMGKYKSNLKMNLGLIVVLIFGFITTYFAIIDLI